MLIRIAASRATAILPGLLACSVWIGTIGNSYGATPHASSAGSSIDSGGSSSESAVSPYSPGSNNLALDIGQVFLMGNLGQYSDSIGTQIHYTYGVSDLFGFDASAGYSNHSNGDFSMATALFGLRTNLSYYDKIVPYSILGLGFYIPSYAYQASDGSRTTLSPLLFGLHVGFGADLLISRSVFFGAGLTVHDVFGTDQNDSAGGTISTGGTFMSFLLHAGMSF